MDISLKYFEEVYTTEHWMVRVYRVLDKCALRKGTTAHSAAWHAQAQVQDTALLFDALRTAHMQNGPEQCRRPSCLFEAKSAVLDVGSAFNQATLNPHAMLLQPCIALRARFLPRQAAPGHKAKEPPTDGQGAGQEAAEARGRVGRAGQGLAGAEQDI